MSYEYVMFRKVKGKWESNPEAPVFQIASKKLAKEHIVSRHGLMRGFGWSGNHDIESVTRLHRGGDMKDTESLDFFFDYTYAPDAMHSVRYREAIRRTK